MKIIGPILLIGGVVVAVLGFQEKAVAEKLASEGKTVRATVVSHTLVRGRKGSKTYKLDARYSPEGANTVIEQTFKVPSQMYDGTSDGSEVTVRYLPSDPATAEIVGAERSGTAQMGIGAVMAVAGLVLAFIGFRSG